MVSIQVLAPQASAARPPPAEPAAEPAGAEQPLPHPGLPQSPWARPSPSAASRSRQAWPPQLRHATWLPTRLQPRQEGPRPRYGCQGTPDPKASDNEEVALQQRRRRVRPAGPRAASGRSQPGEKGTRSRTPHSLCHTKPFNPCTAGAILIANPASRLHRAAPFRFPACRALFTDSGGRCQPRRWGGIVPAPQEPPFSAMMRSDVRVGEALGD